MATLTIATAWTVIEACEFRDTDGCCGHDGNPTPECHAGACPLNTETCPACNHRHSPTREPCSSCAEGGR
jgi:hypothetical protein